MSSTTLRVLFFTLLSIIISYYVAVVLHEYGHATMAWFLGYKSSPFDIKYGSWYLIPISEAVDYANLFATGQGTQAAFIGISGITVTFVLFLISIFLLNQKYIEINTFLLSFVFWLADINLMEMLSYLNRTFIMGDIGEFVRGLNISPFWIFIPSIFIVGFSLYRFYRYEVIKMFSLLPIKTITMQRIYL